METNIEEGFYLVFSSTKKVPLAWKAKNKNKKALFQARVIKATVHQPRPDKIKPAAQAADADPSPLKLKH